MATTSTTCISIDSRKLWHKLNVFSDRDHTKSDVIMTEWSSATSSPEELTFVVGRWLRPIVVVLDVVRRIRIAADI